MIYHNTLTFVVIEVELDVGKSYVKTFCWQGKLQPIYENQAVVKKN